MKHHIWRQERELGGAKSWVCATCNSWVFTNKTELPEHFFDRIKQSERNDCDLEMIRSIIHS